MTLHYAPFSALQIQVAGYSCLHLPKIATKGLMVLGMEWVRAHDLQ